jgi:hypothetical protein
VRVRLIPVVGQTLQNVSQKLFWPKNNLNVKIGLPK